MEPVLRPLVALGLSLVAAACGSPATGAPDAGPHPRGDGAAPDDGSMRPEPRSCPDGHACNALLLDDGRCPADCVPVEDGIVCHGVTHAGLCFGDGSPPPASGVVLTEPLRAEVVRAPTAARVGEEHEVEVRFENASDAPLNVPFVMRAGDAWTLLSASLPEEGELSLGAHESTTLLVRLRAERFTGTDPGAWRVVSWHPADEPRSGVVVSAPVHLASGGVECGGGRFPERWSPAGGGLGYETAMCCGGTFHPGAECCTSADCDGTACADGLCIPRVPNRNPAPSPLGAPVHVLAVLMDDVVEAPPGEPCSDRAAELRDELGLDAIDGWFAEAFVRRTGAPPPPFEWTVLAGIATADVGAPSSDFRQLAPAVARHLEERGCFDSVAEQFDRLVVATPNVTLPDAGSGEAEGIAWGLGQVILRRWYPSLVTHELAHTFGARDLYLDAGSRFGRAGALMGFTTAPDPGEYRDDVAWAEMGLGDWDRDGVVDAFQFAHAPDELVVGEVDGLVATGSTPALEIALRIDGLQDGHTLYVVPQTVEVELVDHGLRVSVDPYEWRGFPHPTRLLARFTDVLPSDVAAAVAAAGTARLRVRAMTSFADDALLRHTRVLDVTLDAPIEDVSR